jgi:hypothetical protein
MRPQSDQAKIDLIAVHANCEFEKDWDGVLATMLPSAHYDYFPYRLRVSGAEAMKVMWERTRSLPCLNLDTGRKIVGLERCTNNTTVVDTIHMTFNNEEGELINTTVLGIFHFDANDRITSETIHFDANATPYVDRVFMDPNFTSLAGVHIF